MSTGGECRCGCCEGPDRLAGARHNAPGAPTIDYRAGTHATFKAALLARLSSTRYPALAALRTREDNDSTVAACDAAATLLDVLTFYQERYANEFFLRTATERRSLVELARLIGYRPSPGVAAGTRVAFLLETAPGAPSLAAEPVTIGVGTRIQSVPGPGEEPQTFETVEPVAAKVEWNAIPVRTTERQTFAIGTKELFISGIDVQLQSGDVILLVGDERIGDPAKDNWDARVIDTVERANELGVTRVTFASGLGQANPAIAPSSLNPRAYVFRQRTALFGHSAPDPNLMFNGVNAPADMTEVVGTGLKWAGYKITGNVIDLDGSFPKVLEGTWVLLAGGNGSTGMPALPGLLELYRVKDVRQRSRTAFGLSGRVTRVTPDTIVNLSQFGLDTAVAFAHSERMPLAPRRLNYPLYGAALVLARVSRGLEPNQEVAVAGRRQRLRVIVELSSLKFVSDEGDAVAIKPNDSFLIAAAPAKLVSGAEVTVEPGDLAAVLSAGSALMRWRVIDRDGGTGTLDVPASAVALHPSLESDPVVRELSVISDGNAAVTHDRDGTTLQLDSPLAFVYDRDTATVCANIARATNGETVSEIAGSGNAAVAGQRFTLRQSPLTYVSATTPDGSKSTLDVRVDGLSWNEVPTLFRQPPHAHVYALRQDSEGSTVVQFGDGMEGARLPTGQDNVRFTYRKFLGGGGNLDGGRLTTLLGRPLGVKAVSNVTSASGGQDPESLGDARARAPLTMLTLGRAVSLQDYTDFARCFAGIARAQAVWIGAGSERRIFVTVAGPAGAAVAAGSDTMVNLAAALRKYGDPLVPLSVASYAAVTFRIEARIKTMSSAQDSVVLAAVEHTLRKHFAFDARDFGQTVSIDEVMAVIQGVSGVEGADVDALFRIVTGGTATLTARLFAHPARLKSGGTIEPAELLTLDPTPLQLGVMS